MRIEIKNRWDGSVLFGLERDGNSVKRTLSDAVEAGADLRGAYLRWANLRGADLGEADLGEADLRGAVLVGADLRWADLQGANLRGAYLEGAYLFGANLRGADLYGANLRGAYLEGANLQGAYLYWANLRGADLEGANLRWARYGDGVPMETIPLQILGLKYPVCIFDHHIKIGCELHSIDEWEQFTDTEIMSMDGKRALRFWREHKANILAVARTHEPTTEG